VNATSSLGLLAGGPVLAVMGVAPTSVLTGALTALVSIGVLGVARRDGAGPRAVPAPEQARVHEQREELVHADAVLPVLGQW
jgi:hypothetical protein